MRLLLRLKSVKDQFYDLRYHHKLQGFIYSLLDGSPYVRLHDKRGYKFFCFSNIFPERGEKNDPAQDMSAGEVRQLLISSPEVGLIGFLNDRLVKIVDERAEVNIGDMSFRVESVNALEPRLGRSCRLVTGTPIVLRIPKERFESYGIVPPRDYDYVYWRKEWPFEPFVKQLEENLFKKYREFYGGAAEEFPIFEQFVFKKTVCNHVVMGGKEVKMLGSIWEFHFSYLEGKKRELIQFGLDAGFGELNSMGFGFMNVVR
ncbi:MAG: CRISPR-associated endoribonuclease Cas6 [Candidatus Hadarchaeum sp.]|uniref:CRISPR-associated endoribonuclease Cas6 n=1 Tax=Candidatus Hadarchaeum sp. TaxID=2883567 RepID=UPI003D0D0ADB